VVLHRLLCKGDPHFVNSFLCGCVVAFCTLSVFHGLINSI